MACDAARAALARLAAAVLVLASCGGAPSAGARVIGSSEVTSSPMSAHDGGAMVFVAADAGARAALARLVPGLPSVSDDRVLIAAFQGEQRTGGYAIAIERVERDGDRLVVRASFAAPPPDALVTQVITSPVHVVAVGRADVSGIRTAILLDPAGTERARADDF